jgi:hypothetical protein
MECTKGSRGLINEISRRQRSPSGIDDPTELASLVSSDREMLRLFHQTKVRPLRIVMFKRVYLPVDYGHYVWPLRLGSKGNTYEGAELSWNGLP